MELVRRDAVVDLSTTNAFKKEPSVRKHLYLICPKQGIVVVDTIGIVTNLIMMMSPKIGRPRVKLINDLIICFEFEKCCRLKFKDIECNDAYVRKLNFRSLYSYIDYSEQFD